MEFSMNSCHSENSSLDGYLVPNLDQYLSFVNIEVPKEILLNRKYINNKNEILDIKEDEPVSHNRLIVSNKKNLNLKGTEPLESISKYSKQNKTQNNILDLTQNNSENKEKLIKEDPINEENIKDNIENNKCCKSIEKINTNINEINAISTQKSTTKNEKRFLGKKRGRKPKRGRRGRKPKNQNIFKQSIQDII